MKKKVFTVLLLISASVGIATAQYVYPKEPEVLRNLNEWQDLKFGLFMHWGPYSQWGIVESWTLEPRDKGWGERPKEKPYYEYVHEYEALQTTFNPVNFAPEKWSAAAKPPECATWCSLLNTTTVSACSTPSSTTTR
jgi:hypothetical protein